MSEVSQTGLVSSLFGDPDVDHVFGDRATVQALLDVEGALSDALADAEMIPRAAADGIRQSLDVERFDLSALRAEAVAAGNLAIPLVRQLRAVVAATDPAAAMYVHWGATSQDIIDTALVLQLRGAVPVILGHLTRAERAATQQARSQIGTVMPGRTWLQQAVPITFGLKAAGWFEACARQRGAVAAALEEASVVQFGGSAGTLAAFGDR